MFLGLAILARKKCIVLLKEGRLRCWPSAELPKISELRIPLRYESDVSATLVPGVLKDWPAKRLTAQDKN